MIWLILAVLCSLAIATLLKMTERRGIDRAALLTVNYAVAGLLGAVLIGRSGYTGLHPMELGPLLLGVGTGILFIGGFYLFAFAIREAGMGLATATIKIAVVVPVLFSWVVWQERPSQTQLFGLLIASGAFALIAWPSPVPPLRPKTPSRRDVRTPMILALLFAVGGLVDVAMKTFGEVFAPTVARPVFLLVVFGAAFLVGASVVIRRSLRGGVWPGREIYAWGFLLGIVNYGSATFILGAIQVLAGPVVFPVNNIATVLGATALGVVVWGEQLSLANWMGLLLGVGAMLFLWG